MNEKVEARYTSPERNPQLHAYNELMHLPTAFHVVITVHCYANVNSCRKGQKYIQYMYFVHFIVCFRLVKEITYRETQKYHKKRPDSP